VDVVGARLSTCQPDSGLTAGGCQKMLLLLLLLLLASDGNYT